MALKTAIALEFANKQDCQQFLRGLRDLLAKQSKAPKYKVVVKFEAGNEEIGDPWPLSLYELGLDGEPMDATPIEQYIKGLDSEQRPSDEGTNSLERGE